MKEVIDLSEINITSGILHDQKLESIKLESDKLVLLLDIHYTSDCDGNEFCEKYKPFKKCEMVIELYNNAIFSVSLQTATKMRTGKFKGFELEVSDFIDLINQGYEATYLYSYVNSREIIIEIFINTYNAKGKFRKYRKCCSCNLTLEAKNVTFSWL